MGHLAALYQKKYGASKEAAGMTNLSPKDQAKFKANKKNPPGPAGGPGTGAKKEAAEQQFLGGKTASAAFFDELGKLNAADEATIKEAALKQDPLIKALKEIA